MFFHVRRYFPSAFGYGRANRSVGEKGQEIVLNITNGVRVFSLCRTAILSSVRFAQKEVRL